MPKVSCVPAVAALALAVWGATEARALGGDHGKEQLATRGATCVHGYFINSSDVYFHQGDTAAFNKFVADAAQAPGAKLRIVVHQGTTHATSPWTKPPAQRPADWSATTGPMASALGGTDPAGTVRIDLWLGGQVKRGQAKFPAGAELAEAPAAP